MSGLYCALLFSYSGDLRSSGMLQFAVYFTAVITNYYDANRAKVKATLLVIIL
jgi:hypothetical protein